MRTDQDLLHRWRQGDRSAGDELLGRHFEAICRFFRSKLGDDVDELLQRTFMSCIEDRERFRGESSFRSYLFGIARNLLLMELRSRRRAPKAADVSLRVLADQATSPSGRYGAAEQRQVVCEALARLPVEQQITLELAYREGMTGREMAVTLGIPENTVRSRLSRARDALRREVERGEAGARTA